MLQKYSLGSLPDYSSGKGSAFSTPPGEPTSHTAQEMCQFSSPNPSALGLGALPLLQLGCTMPVTAQQALNRTLAGSTSRVTGSGLFELCLIW